MEHSNETREKASVSFAAIDPYLADNIVKPTETEIKDKGRDMVQWGDNNGYPDYLLDLYNNVATLRSIVNGCVDFATGDDVTFYDADRALNKVGQKARDIVKLCAGDFYRYGGFALQVIRDRMGAIAEVYYCDLRYLRSNKEGDVFYYSEEYTKKYARASKIITYPAFMPIAIIGENRENASSILYIKNVHTQTYPAPLYAASVKACEIERSIDKFHLNSINNNFTGSLFVNFNNGEPSDEIKDEIERDFMEKFSGSDNAGRIGFSYNKDMTSRTTFEKISVDDFGARYESLAKHCRQQIFTAFRANPNLFGIPTESLGFSSEEYESAFRLFNRTQIKPVQDLIVDAFDRIYGVKGSITIVPFTLGI